MQRINTPDNLFHDGDPTTGALGSIVTAAIMNAIQSEIIAPITAAGIALDPTNNGQLLAAILALIESKTGNYGLDTGAANAYVTALTPPVQAYTNGLPIKFRATHANTGQSTVNAGGGAVPLLRDDGTPLVSGDIPVNGIVSATFDTGVNAFLINSIVASQFDAIVQAGSPTYAPDTGAANAYKASYTPTVTTLTDGMKLRFRAKSTNTTASTFAPDTVPAAPIWGGDHAPLTGSEIVVNGEVEVQWNAAINGGNGAWVLCENTGGYQKGPTPPQFDNSAKLVNSAWVKAAGMQFSTTANVSASRNLVAADIGAKLLFQGAFTLTIPTPQSIGAQQGDVVVISAYGANTGTVAFSGTTYAYGTAGQSASLTVNNGESLMLVVETAATWQVGPSTAGLGLIGSFGSSLSTNGYQKLPSGLIIQWGTVITNSSGQAVITFPLAFPSNMFRTIMNPVAGNYTVGNMNSSTLSGVNQNIVVASTGALAGSGVVVGFVAFGN